MPVFQSPFNGANISIIKSFSIFEAIFDLRCKDFDAHAMINYDPLSIIAKGVKYQQM